MFFFYNVSKVLEIPRNGVAVLLSEHPRACTLEAEANLAPLRQFFERELFVEVRVCTSQLHAARKVLDIPTRWVPAGWVPAG